MKTFAALSLAASLAGCATAGGHAPGGLAGTHWAIVSIDGTPAAAPDRARLSFDEARLSASVGCNGLGGDYRVDGGRLIVGPVVSTQMWCEAVMDQERAVGALFAGAPQVTRNGDTLKLASGGHTLEAKATR